MANPAHETMLKRVATETPPHEDDSIKTHEGRMAKHPDRAVTILASVADEVAQQEAEKQKWADAEAYAAELSERYEKESE